MALQQLNLNEDASDGSRGFWKRQFQQESTGNQRIFDWAYGVIVPIICVAADPIVFKGFDPLLVEYRPFAYLLSAASILAMSAWLLWGKRLGWLSAPIGGLFVLGSAVSFVVGVGLFPLSFIGLFFVIGFLGFTPLFSALVYLRNGIRAFRFAKSVSNPDGAFYVGLLSSIFSLVVPFVVNAEINMSIKKLTSGTAETIRWETRKLKFVGPLADYDRIAREYRNTPDNSAEKNQLKIAYEELTGEPIESARPIWD